MDEPTTGRQHDVPVDGGLGSAILQVVADHYLEVGHRHFSPVQMHSAIRWTWSWLTDPEDARVFTAAHDLAVRGLLKELPPRSGSALFTDYQITEAGHIYLRDFPPPHPCQPPQGVDPAPVEWICPDCGAVFRPRVRLDQLTFRDPYGKSGPASWSRVSDGSARTRPA